MSVVDYLLNSLIKKLQKTQKARKKRKKAKRKPARPSRKSAKSRPAKKRTAVKKKKTIPRKSPTKKKPVKKSPKKASKPKKKSPVKKKKIARKPSVRPKSKSATVKRAKKAASNAKNLPKEVCIGEITHFFSRIQVVVLKMTNGRLSVGDQIHIKGRGMDFIQKVESLQIESVDVKVARKGQLVGLKVNKAVKVGGAVYKSAR